MRIYFSADVVINDGGDTNAYGEPCEEGHGYYMESGWISPDQTDSYRPMVWEIPEDSGYLEWTPEDGPMIDWAVTVLLENLGTVDHGNGPTFYAREVCEDLYGRGGSSVAAHVEGASPAVLAAIQHAISRASKFPYPDYMGV